MGEDADFFATLIARSESASRRLAERRAFPLPPSHSEWLWLPPTGDECQALPIGSLPHAWLQMSASVHRARMGLQIDGVSMLLELALRGLLDVPPVAGSRGTTKSGVNVVVAAPTGHNAAVDGALERLRALSEPLTANAAAARIASYVAALAVSAIGVEQTRARVEDAIVGEGATDIRTALVVWMLKQEVALGDFPREEIFPGRPAVTRRALRRARPNFYAVADDEVAAAAHRVLFANAWLLRPR